MLPRLLMSLPFDAIFQQRNTRPRRPHPHLPRGNPSLPQVATLAVLLFELIFEEMSSVPQKPL